MNWYALYVQTGQEETVKKLIRLHFDESTIVSIAPKRRVPEKREGRVSHVLKNMFPGYVLIRANMNAQIYHELKKIPKTYRVLNNGDCFSKEEGTYFTKITDEEMAPIMRLIGDGEIIDCSKVYVENSKVFVTSGPLHGMEGLIKKIDRHKNRAKIQINFMGAEKIFDVGIEILSSPDELPIEA